MSLWWLSFRDENNDYCLGVCVVEAANEDNALQVADAKGIHPGGEAMMFEMTEEHFREEPLELNRLYSMKDMENHGYERTEVSQDAIEPMRKGDMTWGEFEKFKL